MSKYVKNREMFLPLIVVVRNCGVELLIIMLNLCRMYPCVTPLSLFSNANNRGLKTYEEEKLIIRYKERT